MKWNQIFKFLEFQESWLKIGSLRNRAKIRTCFFYEKLSCATFLSHNFLILISENLLTDF